MRCGFESFHCNLDITGGTLKMKKAMKAETKRRIMQVVVVLLIAAVVITYSISFIGYL